MALRSHLQQAQTLALDPNQPISAALRHLVALGATPELADIRDWALKELKGYAGTPLDQLPAYRKLRSRLTGTLFNGVHQVKNAELELHVPPEYDDESRSRFETLCKLIPLVHPVGEVEELLSQARQLGMLRHPLPPFVLPHVRSPQFEVQCIEAYLPMPPAPLAGALDEIRTAVVDFVSVALASLPEEHSTLGADDSREAKALIYQVFHDCQIGVTSTNVVNATHSSIRGGIGTSHNSGVVAAQHLQLDALDLKAVVSELRVLTGALMVQSSENASTLGQLTDAIAEFEARAHLQGVETFKTVEDVQAMLEPIWEKHMGEKLQTTGQRLLQQGGGKVLSALPGIARMIG